MIDDEVKQLLDKASLEYSKLIVPQDNPMSMDRRRDEFIAVYIYKKAFQQGLFYDTPELIPKD